MRAVDSHHYKNIKNIRDHAKNISLLLNRAPAGVFDTILSECEGHKFLDGIFDLNGHRNLAKVDTHRSTQVNGACGTLRLGTEWQTQRDLLRLF